MLPAKRKPTHPGEVLEEEFLIPLGVFQKQFAEHLGGSWTQLKLSAIVNGRRAVTEAIALDFADALGTTPEFWLNLQSQYDLWEAKQHRRAISRIHPKPTEKAAKTR